MGLVQEYLIMLLIVLVWLFLGFLTPVEPAAVLTTTATNISTTAAPMTVKDIEKELEGLLATVSKMALPYFVRNSDLKLSPPCMSTLIKLFMDIRKLKLPVVKMLDAMAKPPYGMLKGTFGIMGDYDECLEVRATKRGDVAFTKEDEFYHGQYCKLDVSFPPSLVNTIADYNKGLANLSAFGKLGSFINEFPATNFAGGFFKFKIGICVPSTCSRDDIKEMVKLVPVSFLNLQVGQCDDGQAKELNTDQVVFIFFIILFGVLVLCGTILEAWFYLRQSGFNGYHKDKFVQFLLAFSMYGNTKKMMKPDRSSTGDIPVINGMYVTGTVLVVLYHTYFMPFILDFTSHGATLGEYLKDFKFTLLATMAISIEAYFLFSGILLVYPRFRRGESNVKINVLKVIVRRYIRLCPSLLVILGIIVFLPVIGSGPVWEDILGRAADNTRKWWWTYALMINNFLAIKDQNFLYLWFIPCLMQITIVGVALLWIISKSPKVGITLTILIGLACNVALGVLTAMKNYPPVYAVYYFHKRENYELPIYTSPLSHVFSYGIGMILGLYMAKNQSPKWSKTHVVLGWIFAILCTTGIQLLAYLGHDGMDPDPIVAAVYAGTHRTLFALGMAWIILACTHGYGGWLGKFLCWKGFGVMGKLGYFGYLIHYIVITYHVSQTRVPLMYSHYEVFMRFFSYSVLTFGAAYLLYIVFELPLVFFESLFLPSRPTEPKIQNNITIAQSNDSKQVDVIAVKYNDALTPNVLDATWTESQQEDKENPEHSKL